MNKPFIQLVLIDLAGQHPIEMPKIYCEIVRVRKLGPVHLLQFLKTIAQHPLQLIVYFNPALFRRGDGHANLAMLEVAPESFLTFAQRFPN